MKFLKISVAVVLFALCGSVAFGVEYWPTDPNVIYSYETNVEGDIITLSAEFSPTQFATASTMTYRSIQEHVDANGDLYFDGISYIWSKGLNLTFSSPDLFLDLPLWVGKSWDSTFLEDQNNPLSEITCHHEVVGTTEVTVGAGTFSVMVVEVTVTPTNSYSYWYPEGTYHLHETLGPVILPNDYSLASYSGVVATEEQSWSTVKALFR